MELTPKHPKTARLFAALLATLDISASKLAREISTPAESYSQQVISNYVSGKSKASETVLAAIARRYPAVNPMWLLTGEGQPFPDGRYNERARPAADPTAPPAPTPGLTSGAATVAEAENVLLREQLLEVKADKARLIDEVNLLRVKSTDSPDAAGPRNDAPRPTPRPVVGFLLSVQRRARRGTARLSQ